MIEKLELLYHEILGEATITSQTITRLVDREMQFYYWNIGRILMNSVDSQNEFTQLSTELLKSDRTMTTARLMEYMNLYESCPNIEDLR